MTAVHNIAESIVESKIILQNRIWGVDIITLSIVGVANIYLWKKTHLNLHIADGFANMVAFTTGIIFSISYVLPISTNTFGRLLLLECIPLAGIIFYKSLQLRKKIAQFRKSEQSAIDS
jgi:hypothetical protein